MWFMVNNSFWPGYLELCCVAGSLHDQSSTEALALESKVLFPGRNSGHSWLLEDTVCPEQPLPTFLRQRTLETWKNADFLQTPVAGSFFLAGPAVYPSTLNQPTAQASWALGVFLESHEMCGWLWILETQPLTSTNWFYKKFNQVGKDNHTQMLLVIFIIAKTGNDYMSSHWKSG